MVNFPSPEPALAVVLSALLGVVAVFVFYVVIDTAGLSTGPVHPDLLMAMVVGGLALVAAVFVYALEIRYAVFFVTIFPTVPVVVFLREYIIHGIAGVDSPVTLVFMIFILGALWIGGGIGAGLKTAM